MFDSDSSLEYSTVTNHPVGSDVSDINMEETTYNRNQSNADDQGTGGEADKSDGPTTRGSKTNVTYGQAIASNEATTGDEATADEQDGKITTSNVPESPSLAPNADESQTPTPFVRLTEVLSQAPTNISETPSFVPSKVSSQAPSILLQKKHISSEVPIFPPVANTGVKVFAHGGVPVAVNANFLSVRFRP